MVRLVPKYHLYVFKPRKAENGWFWKIFHAVIVNTPWTKFFIISVLIFLLKLTGQWVPRRGKSKKITDDGDEDDPLAGMSVHKYNFNLIFFFI